MRRRVDGYETSTPGLWAAKPDKLWRARLFRQAPTSAEAMLWQGLRRRLVAGLKFRRQHVIAGYVADFYCPALRLVIEVDGDVHDAQRERDAQRTAHLGRLGVTVFRIPNARVFSDLAGVVADVVDCCERLRAAIKKETVTKPASPLRRSPSASGKDPPFPRNRGKGDGG
jgi:very-short-patch-repair endonuclease